MKQPRLRLYVVLIAFVLCVTVLAALPTVAPAGSSTATPRLNFESGVCFEIADTLEPPRSWIPLGCEAVVCCPGCPDVGIDWRIQVSGDPLESVLLQFENLPPDAMRKLKIKGKARWEGSALRVMPGETVVSGFKNDPRAVPAVATPRLFANKGRLRQLQAAAERQDAVGTNRATEPDRPIGRMEVFVEQMMGKYAVSESRVAYNVKRCDKLPGTGDRILLNNNALNDDTIALIDAQGSGGCLRDQEFRGVVALNLGDLRPFNDCTSETTIFSDDNGVYFVTPSIWTTAVDEQVVNLPKMVVTPVTIWSTFTEAPAHNLPEPWERAEYDMALANYLYNSNKAGIGFEPNYASALDLGEIARGGCSAASRIRASEFFRPGEINVYYIDKWIYGPDEDHWLGQTCWNKNENKPTSPGIIFVNRFAPPETLAHELGHAFSLDDLDLLDAAVTAFIGGNNIMWQGVAARSDFTIGQSFRMSVNSISMINVNGVRSGFTRGNPPCFDATETDRCPKLSKDVNPK